MAEAYQDKEIQCCDCPNKFIFTAGEQEFFASKNFTPPRRCKPCREIRKREKEEKAVREGGSPPSVQAAPVWQDENRGNSYAQNEGREEYREGGRRRRRGR